MSLFGPPNVDKLRKKGNIGKLVGLLHIRFRIVWVQKDVDQKGLKVKR